jgi:hypothetical protein
MSSRSISDTLRTKLRRTPEVIATDERSKFIKLDLATRVDVSSLVTFPRPHQVTIDVIPDTRFMILAIHDGVSRAFSSGNFRDNAYVTPASVTAYSLILVYGFLLLSDSCYRQVPSPFAESILHLPMVQEFIDIIANASVPDFLVPILQGLIPHSDSILQHLDFVPTLACYFHALDYGRVIPASCFLAAHNAISENVTNAHPSSVLISWYRTILLNNRTAPASITTVNDHIFGFTFAGTAFSLQDSWLSTTIASLVNPVTSRFQTARPTFSRVPIYPQTISDWTEFNPYLYNIGLSSRNSSQMFHFIRNLSEYSRANFAGGLTLFHISESASAASIVSHLISGPSYPTWHTASLAATAQPVPTPIPANATFTTVPTVSRQPVINFLVDEPTADNANNIVNYPAVIHPVAQLQMDIYFRVENHALPAANNREHPIKFVLFDEPKHNMPQMFIYNALAQTSSAMFNCLISGIIIENGPVDGFVTHVPNPDMTSSDNNVATVYASAISAVSVYLASDIASTSHTTCAVRPTHRWPSMPNAVLHRDMTQVILPRIHRTVAGPYNLHQIGLRPVDRFITLKPAISFYGRNTSNVPNNIPDSNRRHILFWSSYRILEDERHEYLDTPAHRITLSRFSMLTSLRNIFGARSLIGSVPHPASLIH